MTDVEMQQDTTESSPDAQDPLATKNETITTAVSGGSSSGKSAKKPKNERSTHPPTSEMVNAAIKNLQERGGSSLQAIKKYMTANYKVNAEKMATYIKKYIKFAVASGILVQTKGTGASGSFRLAEKTSAKKKTVAGPKARATAAKKPTSAKTKKAPVAAKPSVATAKKTTTKAKKSPAGKKKSATPTTAVASSKAVAVKTKSPSKAKKVTKVPTKKPKSPKPKTVKKIAAQKPSPRKGGLRKKN